MDHGIRRNSHKEALQVKKLLKINNINLKILRNKKKIVSNIQKNARDIRYGLLIKYCKKKHTVLNELYFNIMLWKVFVKYLLYQHVFQMMDMYLMFFE